MNIFFPYWLIISFLFLMFELGHPGLFFFLSFSAAGFVAALISIITDSLAVQIAVFVIVTCISYLVLKLILGIWYNFPSSHHQSNVYALIGKKALVIKEISPDAPGQVKYAGDIWIAKTAQEFIPAGAEVEIVNTSGSHLIVRSVSKEK